MKKERLILFALPALLLVGCVHEPARYSQVAVAPGETVVVTPSPVSDRPVMRVYPEGPVRTATLPPGVTAEEHAIAETIRNMFNGDPAWASTTDRVEVRVSGSKVELRGFVPNDAVRDRIAQKIALIPGVTDIDNGLRAISIR